MGTREEHGVVRDDYFVRSDIISSDLISFYLI